MNRRLGYRIALIATPFVAFVLYAALNWYEVDERKVRTGLSQEAARDPWLALGRFLPRMGVATELTQASSRLAQPPEGGVLVLGGARLAFMTPERIRALDAWVRRGGHLVAVSERWGVDDPLLEHYGLERHVPPEAKDPDARAKPKSRRIPAPDDAIAQVTWPGVERPLRVRMFGPGLVFSEDGDTPADVVTSTLDGKIALTTFPSGKGRVTFAKDLGFLSNAAIGKLDHAELAWRLAGGSSGSGPVTLFLRAQSPSLWEWLREHAWTVLVAGMLLTLAWLARIIPRFGPLVPAPPPIRRSLLEHLRAAGRYTWARGDAMVLVDALRDRAWRTALRRRGGLKGLAHSQAQSTFAEVAGRAPETVHLAMQGGGATPAAFVATTGALQEIEAGLAHRPQTKNKRREKK